MKAFLIFFLLMVVFSWGRRVQRRTLRLSAMPKGKRVAYQVNYRKGFNWRDITTEDKFYQMFPNIPRLPQHRKGTEGVLRPFKPRKPGTKRVLRPFKPRKPVLHVLLGSKGPLGVGKPGNPSDNGAQIDTSTGCASRRTLIDLPIQRAFGQHIFPSCTWMKRCTGCMCSASLTCKPVKERTRTVYFYRIYGQRAERDEVTVNEHLQCSCQCIRSASSCNRTTQIWNQGNCDCDCKPEYQNTVCRGDLKYDPKTCGCVCARVFKHCPLGLEWSTEDCRCILKHRIIAVPKLQKLMRRIDDGDDDDD